MLWGIDPALAWPPRCPWPDSFNSSKLPFSEERQLIFLDELAASPQLLNYLSNVFPFVFAYVFFSGCNQCGTPVYSTCDCLLVMASKVLHLRICTHNEWVNTTETFSFVVNKTETIERRPRCLCKSCVEKTQRIKRYVKCIREKLQVSAAKIYSVNLKYKDSTKIHLLFPEMHYEKSTASMQMVNPNPNNNLWVREWAVRCSASMAHKRSKWTSNNFHSRLRNMTSAWAFTDNNMSF